MIKIPFLRIAHQLRCGLALLLSVYAFAPATAALPSAPIATAGLTDTIDVAALQNEQAHLAQQGGSVTRTLGGDVVGGYDMRHLTRQVSGRGSWIVYRLQVIPEQPTTIEFEELYGRDQDVRGYLVFVNGVKVYLRTWQGCGAGPVHYFVQLPPGHNRFITLKLENQLATPFNLSRIWAFSNFRQYFAANHLTVPYYLAPTAWLSYTDYNADLAKLRQIKTSLGDHPNAKPAWTTWLGYANLNDHEVGKRIDYIFRLATALEMPVQIAFDTWWANTPSGADGKGGFWTDVQYQQVVYNASQKRYQLSVPNQWSNTPWLTVNNPDLNAYKAYRLRTAMAHLRQSYEALRARGQGHLLLALNLDNEPVYWASGNAGLGSDLLWADFNPATIEAARQAGIALDPTTGLTEQARLWLSHNLLSYNTLIASAMADSLGRDAVVVDGNTVSIALDLLRNNIYTQAMVANAAIQYPTLSAAYPFWETAAPGNARVGGEWNGDSLHEIEAVTHQLALGRNAAVNAEAGNDATNMQGVKPGYALAQRYFTLYNYPLDKMDVAAAAIRDLTASFPAFRYQPILREDEFRDNSWQQHVVAYSGLQSGVIGNTAAIAIYPSQNTVPGYLTYKLDAPQQTFSTGLFLEWSGRAFVFRKQDANVNIRVLAGPTTDAAAMQEVGKVFDNGDINAVHRVDLSTVAPGRSAIYVRIELNAPGLPASVLSWCSIYHIRFTTAWPNARTRDLLPQDESLDTVRQQNLVVSWRRDAELAIGALALNVNRRTKDGIMQRGQPPYFSARQLDAAQLAYKQGDYKGAYQDANAGLCALIPATYYVKQSGWLMPFPIRVDTTQPVTCIVQEWEKDIISIDLETENSARVSIHLRNLMANQAYHLEKVGTVAGTEWGWSLRRSKKPESGTLLTTNQRGELSWTATVTAPHLLQNPILEGTFAAQADGNAVSVLPDIPDGDERIVTDEHTIIKRGAPGQEAAATLAAMQRGDQVLAHLDANGIATELTAMTQTLDGSVREFGQSTPYAMPYIVLDTDGQRHIIDLAAPLHLSGATVTMKSQPLGTAQLAVGDKVRVRLNPKTGRVFELWKIG